MLRGKGTGETFTDSYINLTKYVQDLCDENFKTRMREIQKDPN